MKEENYRKMFELDKTHWWFYGQRLWLKQFCSKFRKQGKRWLDVGCGVGDISRMLQEDLSVFGVDRSDIALSYSKKRNIHNLIKGDALFLPFKNETFDLISLLGVMYHAGIESDFLCLKECIRVCRKGGFLFFSEPVIFLKGAYDIEVNAARRYSVRRFRDLILKSGLKIEKITYFNFFAFFPIFLIRKLEKFRKNKRMTDDLSKPNAAVNFLMILLVRLETLWIKYLPLPIGSSVICVARKI